MVVVVFFNSGLRISQKLWYSSQSLVLSMLFKCRFFGFFWFFISFLELLEKLHDLLSVIWSVFSFPLMVCKGMLFFQKFAIMWRFPAIPRFQFPLPTQACVSFQYSGENILEKSNFRPRFTCFVIKWLYVQAYVEWQWKTSFSFRIKFQYNMVNRS